MNVKKVGYGYVATNKNHTMHVGNFGTVMSCTANEKSATYHSMRAAVSKFVAKGN